VKPAAYLLLELLKDAKAVQYAAEIGSYLNTSSHLGDLRCRLVDLSAAGSVLALWQKQNGEY